jgi:hypothetical protein
MSYADDNDSANEEDSVREQAYLDYVFRLLEGNEVRYREEAKTLLKDGEYWHSHGNSVLVYSIENRGCASRISMDGGFDFHLLSWTPLGFRKTDKYRTLEFNFAQSEAQLESGE